MDQEQLSSPQPRNLYDGVGSESRCGYVRALATAPAETVSPAEVMGEDRWNELVAQDPTGGAAALAQFQQAWAWTPEANRRDIVARRILQSRISEIAGTDAKASTDRDLASRVSSLVNGDPSRVGAAQRLVLSGSPAEIIQFRHASLFGN